MTHIIYMVLNIPAETVVKGQRAKEIQPVVSAQSAYIIQRASKQQNKKMSQGMVSYEILMMYYESSSDIIDEREEMLNKSLRQNGLNPSLINNVTLNDDTHNNNNKNENRQQIRLWLPLDVYNSLQQNNEISTIGAYIDECVSEYIQHPFRDRADRVQVKEELLKHLKYENKKLNGLAKDIKNNHNKINVPDSLTSRISLDIDNLEEFREKKELMNRWETRINIYESVSDCESIDEITDDLSSIYDINNQYYVERKVREFANIEAYKQDEEALNIPDVKDKKGVGSFLMISELLEKDYTSEEIVRGYIANEDIDKKGRLSFGSFETLHTHLKKLGVNITQKQLIKLVRSSDEVEIISTIEGEALSTK